MKSLLQIMDEPKFVDDAGIPVIADKLEFAIMPFEGREMLACLVYVGPWRIIHPMEEEATVLIAQKLLDVAKQRLEARTHAVAPGSPKTTGPDQTHI